MEEPSWGVHATFQGTVNSTREEITFLAEAAGENAIKRIFSCVIISAMPETGVDEALTTLKDIYEFNSENTRAALPRHTMHSSIAGRVTSTSERPQLVISE